MKACKIILIILLAIKSIVMLIDALIHGEDEPDNVIKAAVSIPLTWLLYMGAGLLTF